MKRIFSSFAILAALLFFALPALAQEGHWRLVQAEYGAGDAWSDVTPVVRSLIRDHRLDIRADNETLGGDPAPDRRKALRLRIENERGETRVLTFAEKAVVQLTVSARGDSDYGSDGDDNRGYDNRDSDRSDGDAYRPEGMRILRADYGADGRFADVTARLAAQVRDGRVALNVNNSTMGGDPADEQRKTLTVWYFFEGRAAVQIVNEHGSLSLPSDADFFHGRLRVMRAQYGADFRYFDVTDRLNSLIQNDQLSLPINNDTMGGDPAPDIRKRLTVVYLFDGRPCRATVEEKASLNLPVDGIAIADDSSLEILRATYGAEGQRADVTDRLRAAANGNRLEFYVSNDSLGGDPAQGMHKTLVVVYRWNDMRYEVAAPEGATLAIP